MQEAMHAARLAMLQAALLVLLAQAQEDCDDGHAPDAIVARCSGGCALDIEFQRAGVPVGGYGL